MEQKILHIAPGYSAGGSLRHALRDVGVADEVLSFPDDLSCGPIDSDHPHDRAGWWNETYADWGIEDALRAFWNDIATSQHRLIVWFGRHSACELSFFHHWVDRLAMRPYDIVDVTGLKLPFIGRDGQAAITRPVQAVSIIPTGAIQPLFGTERPFTTAEREQAARRWGDLKADNAPFRIVTPVGLTSAPEDVFDALLLAQATTDWQKVARVVGSAMGYNYEHYIQVGDMMLHERLVVLIESGRLLAKGDVWDMRGGHIRLPD